MMRIKRSRSDMGEAIRKRKRRKFLEFLGIKASKKLQSPTVVKLHEGGELGGKECSHTPKEEKPLKKSQPCQTVSSTLRVSRDFRTQNGSHKQEDGCDTRPGLRNNFFRRPSTCSSVEILVETMSTAAAQGFLVSSGKKAHIAKSSGRGRKHQKYMRVRDIAWKTAGIGRKHPKYMRARDIAGKTAGSGRKQQNSMRARDSAGKTPDTAVQIDSSDDEEEAVNGSRSAMNSRESCQSVLQRLAKRIVYPSRTEIEAIEILDSDVKNLEPSEFLNDTIIDFYIKYIQREFLTQDPDSRFHFFNSFFYKKLSGVVGKKKKTKVPDFSKLRKWTKGINIFKKDYLIIPVHDKLHWSLAIICFPNHGPGSSSHSERCILHLDSMTNGHQSHTIFRALRRYLVAEWKDTFGEAQRKGDGIIHTLTCNVYPAKKVPVPLQENESDCGLFVLYYIQKFVESAPKTMKISDVEDRLEDLGVFGREWFSPVEASNLRTSIQKILRSLFAENGVVLGKSSNISFGINDHSKLQG